MTLQDVYQLVPKHIENRRQARPRPKSTLSLADSFSLDEQLVIQRLYAQLDELWKYTHPDAPDKRAQFEAVEQFLKFNEFLSLEDQLLSMVEESGEKARKALITQLIRGAFEGICAYIIFVRAGSLEPEYVQQLHYLAHDQMKVMRLLLPDLDVEKRQMDEQLHEHSIELLVEKWRSKTYLTFNDSVQVSFTTHFTGCVAERGMEFAEIDRIFYHLVNHFANYTADKEIHITVARSQDALNLVWVFTKQVTPDRRKFLAKMMEEGDGLFNTPVTESVEPERDDLPLVADAISHIYGYEDTDEAEAAGCYGAKLQGSMLHIWFHWPALVR